MKILVVVLVLGVMSAPCKGSVLCPPKGWQGGYWSRLAAQPCTENLKERPVRIPSPDRKRLLLVKEDKVFEISLGGADPEELFAYRPGEEFLWSPDSNNVLVSFCLGAAGPCGVGATVDVENVTEIVRNEFASGHSGDTCRTYANIGALTWGQKGDEIVFMAEVPPSPECNGRNEGYFESFVISVSQQKILARYDMQNTIQRWRNILGWGLRNDIDLVKEDARGRHK